MPSQIVEHAIKNMFCDYLGFDEGTFYYELIKNKDYLSKSSSHSHSKKYRILNKLFELGVVAKIGNPEENAKYFPLPPTFLMRDIKEEHLIVSLEKIYIKNYFVEFQKNVENKYLTISFRGHANNWLLLFLLKYIMEKKAIILMGGVREYAFYKEHLNNEQFDKIEYYYRNDYAKSKTFNAIPLNFSKISNRRVAIIDDKIFIEFLKFPNSDHYNRPQDSYYVGYILGDKFKTNNGKEAVSYISQMINEIKELIKL